MARTLRLPRADGTLTAYRLTGATPVAPPAGPIRSRIAYAAVHVVADPLAAINPTLEAALDWDATLAYRRYIRSEEHTSELQSHSDLVCRLLLEKKNEHKNSD